MRLGRHRFIVGFSLLVSVMLIGAGCNQKEEAVAQVSEVPVAVAEIASGSLSGSNQITGSAKASKDISVVPKAAGQLKTVAVSKGDVVKKGQVLATLDDTDYQLGLKQAQSGLSRAENGLKIANDNLKQAEAGLRQAEGNLAQAKNGRENNIQNSALAVRNAEIQLEDAKKNLERMEALFQDGLISEQQYENAVSMERQAQLGVEQAKAGAQFATNEDNIRILEAAIDQAKIGVSQAKARVDEAKLVVDEAKLGVEQAKNRLEDTIIKAPVAGEVATVSADVGEMVSGQAPFIRLVTMDVITVDVTVTAEQLMLFVNGAEVDVKFASLEQPFVGEVSYISPTANDSGFFTVEVDVSNGEGLIRPGMVATVSVEQVLVENSFIVPTEAVVERQGNQYIYLVDENLAHQIEIEVIRFDTEYSAIQAEVEAGNKVVIKGQNLLSDGDLVRVVKEEN